MLSPSCLRILRRWLPLLMLSLAPLANAAQASQATELPTQKAKQLIVVTSENWDADSGRLQAYERVHGQWQAHGEAFNVALGRSGSAWGEGLLPAPAEGPQKQEGDGRSPAGVFDIGREL